MCLHLIAITVSQSVNQSINVVGLTRQHILWYGKQSDNVAFSYSTGIYSNYTNLMCSICEISDSVVYYYEYDCIYLIQR